MIVNTREGLTAFSARYPGATVVMETGTHSPWVSRPVAAHVFWIDGGKVVAFRQFADTKVVHDAMQ